MLDWTHLIISLDSCAENEGEDEALKNLSLGAAQATIKEEAQQESVVLNANASPDSTTSHPSNANAPALTPPNDVPNPYQPQQHVTKLPPFHNRIRHSIWLKPYILFRTEKRKLYYTVPFKWQFFIQMSASCLLLSFPLTKKRGAIERGWVQNRPFSFQWKAFI